MRLLMRASFNCVLTSQQANGERVGSRPFNLGGARLSPCVDMRQVYLTVHLSSAINVLLLRTYLTHGQSGAKRGLGQRDTFMPSLRHCPVSVAVAAHLAFSHSVRFGHNLKISHFAFDRYKMEVPSLSLLSITRSTSLKPP